MGTSFGNLESSAARTGSSSGLRFGRHVVGMAAVALANPLIYVSSDKAMVWVLTWLPAIVAAAVLYGLYALFLTTRAKAGWPGSAIMLAWVLLALLLAGNWMNYQQMRQDASAARAAAGLKPFTGSLDQPAPTIDWEKGHMTPPPN